MAVASAATSTGMIAGFITAALAAHLLPVDWALLFPALACLLGALLSLRLLTPSANIMSALRTLPGALRGRRQRLRQVGPGAPGSAHQMPSDQLRLAIGILPAPPVIAVDEATRSPIALLHYGPTDLLAYASDPLPESITVECKTDDRGTYRITFATHPRPNTGAPGHVRLTVTATDHIKTRQPDQRPARRAA
jgi:hypothetical protein